MRKFAYKSIIFFLIISITIFFLAFTYKKLYDIETDYMASIIDKHKRLEQFNDNRLLLVGGSNLAFGINSALIEKELNVNVINLGLHAGLGFDFIINEAISSVKTGDIILLSLEYYIYNESYQPTTYLVDHTQKIFPSSKNFYHISTKDKFLLWLRNSSKRFEKQEILIDSVYNRKSFNKYGDVVGHLSMSPRIEILYRGPLDKIIIDKKVKLLKKLYEKCKSMNARVYILFPNYPITEFNKNKIVIQDLEEQIKLKVGFIKTLNKPETFVFSDDLFYDTVFHLNKKGREKRTKMLIDILRTKVFNESLVNKQ